MARDLHQQLPSRAAQEGPWVQPPGPTAEIAHVAQASWSQLMQQHAAAFAAVQCVSLPPLPPALGDAPAPPQPRNVAPMGGSTSDASGAVSSTSLWADPSKQPAHEPRGLLTGSLWQIGGPGAPAVGPATVDSLPDLGDAGTLGVGAPRIWDRFPVQTAPPSPYDAAGVPPLALGTHWVPTPAIDGAHAHLQGTQTARRLAALSAVHDSVEEKWSGAVSLSSAEGGSPGGPVQWLQQLHVEGTRSTAGAGAPSGGSGSGTFSTASTKAGEVLSSIQVAAAQRQRLLQRLQL